MIELRECPFCGEPGRLRRVSFGYRTNPVVITDRWTVSCPNNCCSVNRFDSEIFQDEEGNVVVKHNGAEEAAVAWNKRK